MLQVGKRLTALPIAIKFTQLHLTLKRFVPRAISLRLNRSSLN